MRATLHDHAPNTYYGQWPGEKPLFPGLESPAIAHNALVASTRFVTFDAPERDFPGNRAPARWKFVGRPKEKSARQAKWRASGDDQAGHRFCRKQQRSTLFCTPMTCCWLEANSASSCIMQAPQTSRYEPSVGMLGTLQRLGAFLLEWSCRTFDVN
jgi:hypothetical protein